MDRLWERTRPAFAQDRTWRRARELALSSLVCLGRHTVTGMLGAAGKQFDDWSAAYRLFGRARFDEERLFATARQTVGQMLPKPHAQDETHPHPHPHSLVVLMDDTRIKKTGRKIHGAKWMRDPLGPPFQVNLIWAQRFLQISAALPEHAGPSRARAIPIDVRHCPAPKKPRDADGEEAEALYRQAQRQMKLTQCAAERLAALRRGMDREPENRGRRLIAVVDGAYTNRTVLKQLPERTTLIGRIRKDAKLYAVAKQTPARGRPRVYGAPLPTPEELRQDPTVEWQKVRAHAAGKTHDFQVKTMGPVRWRGAGGQHTVRVLVVRPLAYRLTKNGRTLYRQPAYLICTDPDLPIEKLLQYYLWRWEIELNFRDEKTLLGVGEAQVRGASAVEKVPQLMVASYAFLLLACEQVLAANPGALKRPKWRRADPTARVTTNQCISHLRNQLWAQAISQNHLTDFAKTHPPNTKPQKRNFPLQSALIYATK